MTNLSNSLPPDPLERTVQGVRNLITEAQAGSRDAIEKLLALHEPMMLRYAHRRLGRPLRSLDETRDILHDAYQIVLRKIDSFVPEDSRSFARWLRGIITRVVLRKAGAPYVVRRAALQDDFQKADLDLTPMTRLSLDELRLHRYRCLRECDRKDRLIYRLRVRGCPSSEIAARIGLTDRAVRMRFAKTDARIRLRMKAFVEAHPRE
jgi:RNA polymerase sigma factor (sigma-70 family)